jgi:hypothetical protein
MRRNPGYFWFAGKVTLLALALVLSRRELQIQAQQNQAPPGTAQPAVTGEPGSPTATTSIKGNQLPPPPQEFRGKIERNAAQSTPYWPARVVPPKDAPNVLLIMTDDTGFYEIGRVIQHVEDMGKLDNTLIIYIAGDNGNSAEGSLVGTPNEVASLQGVDLPVADQLKFYDAWGTDQTYPHMAVAWSWAFDTPFSWTKQIASHFGGVRQGMAISWPKVIKDKGGIRNQFHHIIDIVPTILEATGIPAPDTVDGIRQKPIEGVSMMYSFDVKNANAPSPHHTQYFEMMGDHAIYHDGWIASTKVMRPPWDVAGATSQNPVRLPYELYDLTKDWTQYEDVAAKYPDKVKEMDKLFWEEASKYQVLPLDTSVATRVVAPRPSLAAGRTQFTWSGEITGTPNGDAPSILNSSYNFKAEVEIPPAGAEGMIVTQGGRFGGYGFYLLTSAPIPERRCLTITRYRSASPESSIG